MPTARLLTERPLVEFNEDGLRVLKRELAVDLGVELAELHAWNAEGRAPYSCVSYSPDRTTILSVAPGFVYDGASIPASILLSAIMGDRELYECAGVFHDALFRWQSGRAVADRVFWIVARSGSKQVTPVRGWLGWAGLRIFGWRAYRQRGREARA